MLSALELDFSFSWSFFIGMHSSESARVSDGGVNRGGGEYTAINYEGALTVVETMVVMAAVDAAASVAAPEAGNSGGGIGSVDVGSGNNDCTDNSDGNGNG